MAYTMDTVLLEAATKALINAPQSICWPSNSWFCMTNPEWAAWVQAVGSVIAIFIAVWVPNRQQREARVTADRKELEEVLRFTSIALMLLQHAKEFLTDSTQTFSDLAQDEKPKGFKTMSRHLSPMVQEMRAVPRDKLPGLPVVRPWVVATHAVDNVVFRVELGGGIDEAIAIAHEAIDNAVTKVDERRKSLILRLKSGDLEDHAASNSAPGSA